MNKDKREHSMWLWTFIIVIMAVLLDVANSLMGPPFFPLTTTWILVLAVISEIINIKIHNDEAFK